MKHRLAPGTSIGGWRRPAWRRATVLALPVILAIPGTVAGQSWIKDFVITGGLTGEVWWGDFSAITVPQFDSTENAVAGVGDWSARAVFGLLNGTGRRLEATIDAGIRQSAAGGFQLRNYAPREQSGRLTLIYNDELASGAFTAEATARSRRVVDHPPMPLYKPPGYDIYNLQASYLRSVGAIHVDVKLAGEQADYKPPPQLDHLDYLDRNSVIFEAGGNTVYDLADDPEIRELRFRFYGAFGYHIYPRQGEGVRREDHAIRLGTRFELNTEQLSVAATVSGTRSRSTSRRVEYNRGRLQLQAVWYWGDTDLSLEGTLARKRYIHRGVDALVPGEEADNATIVDMELTRSLGERVDGAFRMGWGKVETNFTGAFYTRFRSGFSLRVRPWG